MASVKLDCNDRKPSIYRIETQEKDSCAQDVIRYKVETEKRRRRINNGSLPVYKWRTVYWCRHRFSVDNVKAKVDSSCPTFPPAIFTGINLKYRYRFANFVRIDLENALLAQKIKRQVTKTSEVGNRLKPTTKCINNRGKTRMMLQNEIVLENMGKAQRLCQVHPEYSRRKQLQWYEQQEGFMERASRYPLYWKSHICSAKERQILNEAYNGQRPIVYFDFEVKSITLGRVIIELNPRAAPDAVANFRALCNGRGKTAFTCCEMDKMWPGAYWAAGKGAQGLNQVPLPPSNKNRMKHNRIGILSLMNNGEGMVDAEFLITARELEPLNGTNLAIGLVMQGMAFLESLGRFLKKNSMQFVKPVRIVKTGELDPNEPFPQLPNCDDSGECTESELETEAEVGEKDEVESGKVSVKESGKFDYNAEAEAEDDAEDEDP